MKIQEIRARIEPEIYSDGFARLTVRVYVENYADSYLTTQRDYPIDYMKSIWDMLWEDIGKEMKEALLKEDENG